jgi:hypothetical protein
MQHLRPEPVEHREADVGAVAGGVDVNPKRTLAERGVDHSNDGIGDRGHLGARRHDVGERVFDLRTETRIGSGLIRVDDRVIGRRARAPRRSACRTRSRHQ